MSASGSDDARATERCGCTRFWRPRPTALNIALPNVYKWGTKIGLKLLKNEVLFFFSGNGQ